MIDKSDEELYDELTHEMQNKLNLEYLKKMKNSRIFNLIGFATFAAIVIFLFLK